MITGIVNSAIEAIVEIEVLGANRLSQSFSAIIDTGFSGALLLTPDAIAALQLVPTGAGEAMLADGELVTLPIYEAVVIWNGSPRIVAVISADGTPLLGMQLLRGFRLLMDVLPHGTVEIKALT